jgi:ubiquinone/menaquinone biosynthesis C-methylase UbiE
MQNAEKDSPEFDQYAHSYQALLEDPVRSLFARDPLHFHRRKWILIERLLKNAGMNLSTLKWLDVGCGQGELLELAGSSFAQAIGCDPSANMLSKKRSVEMHEQPSPVVLPFGDSSVDFVTAVCVFHHVHGIDRTLLINEIRRVLAPGGMCCIIEHNPWNPVTRAIVKRCPVDVDAELLTAQSASMLLQNADFTPLSTDYFLYLPERLFNSLSSIEGVLRKLPFGGQYALLAQLSAPQRRDSHTAATDAISAPLPQLTDQQR